MTATVLTLLELLLATAGFVVTFTIQVLSLLTALLGVPLPPVAVLLLTAQ